MVVVRALPIALLTLLLAAGPHPAAGQDGHDERILFNKYSDLCMEVVRQSPDNREMVCSVLDADEADVRANIRQHVAFVCENISKACQRGPDRVWRETYARRSQTLGCRTFGFECPVDGSGSTARRATKSPGDINALVEAIAAAEQVGLSVPPALKIAIAVYVETRDLNDDLRQAIENVNGELTRFYAVAERRCAEDPSYVEPPPNECTAAIHRRVLYDKVRAALDWSNGNSVISQVTRSRLQAWDIERLKRRGRGGPIILR